MNCNQAIAYLKADLSGGKASGNTQELADADAPVLKSIGNGLLVAFVVDEGDRLAFVQNRHLQQAQLTVDQLYQIGVQNLANKLDGQIRAQQHGPIVGVFLDGNFEASLILVSPLWDHMLAHLVQNGFAVALPSRDVLAFCDAKSKEGIASLNEMIARIGADGNHLLCKSILLRKDGQWLAT